MIECNCDGEYIDGIAKGYTQACPLHASCEWCMEAGRKMITLNDCFVCVNCIADELAEIDLQLAIHPAAREAFDQLRKGAAVKA